MITYRTKDGSLKSIDAVQLYVKSYVPLRTTVTFLPRALQPAPVAGRGGTSSPVQLWEDDIALLLELNPQDRQREWLINNNPGWLYRIINGAVFWSSAVALAGNPVLWDGRTQGEYLRLVGVPADAEMSLENINPALRPYWCHRVFIRNVFQDPHDVFAGTPTYSPMWSRFGRLNDYQYGELWIKQEYLSLIRHPLPIEIDP